MLTSTRLQIGFALVVVTLLLVHAGGPLRLLYPVAAMAIGFRLLTTDTPQYVSFLIWLWVLSPFVRRVADLQAGPQEPSLILLTPYVVAMLGAGQVAVKGLLFPATYRPSLPYGTAMFLLAALGASAGVPLGFASGAPDAALETLNWIVPLLFGAYIASCADDVVEIERATAVAFGRAAVVMGAYGVYQFYSLPVWDADWMQQSGMRSIGSAEVFDVRVFSTMHSPGVLGPFIMIPLVLWLAKPRTWGLVPVCLAAVTLLLSQVRTAWLAFAVAAILVVISLRLATGARVMLLVVFSAICVTPFLQVPEVSERVNTRLQSVRDLPGYDESAVSRLEGHRRVLDFAEQNPFGAGIGSNPPQIQAVVGMRDGVLVGTLVQFGVLGTVLYAIAMCLLLVRLWRYYRASTLSPDALGLSSVGLGLFSTLFLGVPSAGPVGAILWMIGGCAAAREQLRAAEQVRERHMPAGVVVGRAIDTPATG